MDCIKGWGWFAAFAAVIGLFACKGSVGGDPSQAGSGGSQPPVTLGDAGDMPDAGTTAPKPPSGHVPEEATGCVPAGPTEAELGAARQILYPGSTDIEPKRSLWQVSARSQGLFVADEQHGIFRVNARDVFERLVMAQTRSFLDADLGLYFAQAGKVLRVSLSATDATPSDVATGVTATPAFLTYDQDNLYFVDQAAGTLVKLALTSGAQAVMQRSLRVTDMKLHGGSLYYADQTTQQVYRLAVDGDTPEPITAGDSTHLLAIEIAADSETLYFVDGTQIVSTPLGGEPERNAIGQAGPATDTGRGWITSMALHDDRLYWADDVGNLGWTATDGSACGLIVRGAPVANGWDVDDSALYMTVPDAAHGSALWRIAL